MMMNALLQSIAPHGAPPLDAAGFTAAAGGMPFGKRRAANENAGKPREPIHHVIHVPGAALPLVVERDPDGRLLTIGAGERLYVDARQPGQLLFDGGFVKVQAIELPGGLLRRVQLRTEESGRVEQWSERYGWDAKGRLVDVDGVSVAHDEQGRITACIDRDGGPTWHYGYTGEHLTVIQTPHVLRHILRDASGRPVAWRESAHGTQREGRIRYDDAGARLPTRSTPLGWEMDACGRLLAICDDEGRVRRTFLWDGWLCLGAIDGEPGEPLGEVYSLDPGGTPVRVCTRHGMRRLPRDGFGESLLNLQDDDAARPGLYGGAIASDGLVHLPYRRLDPRLASFDCPDPLHGEAGDPRRAGGWQGPLQIELPAAGPYTVCRHNPVSLADPTGAVSDLWWLIPSALTWSMQNTIASLLGMWLNLQFSPLGWIVSAVAGADPFDAEWISANNHDAFGLRADGWMSRIQPVAWTYQFLVNEEKASFTALEDARLFSPGAEFRPTLYASLLRCAPASGTSFVLRGTRASPNATVLTDWSRCGGTAEAAIPGSLLPVFPSGGMHFDTVQRGVHAQTADMIELTMAASPLTGLAGNFAALVVPGTTLGVAAGADVVLADAPGLLEVVRVLDVDEVGPSTLLKVEPTLTHLGGGALRLQGLIAPAAPAGPEALTPVVSDQLLLGVAGSSLDYAPSLSILRLARAGATVHVARVDGLRAQLAIDSPVPAAVGNDFSVRSAMASGNFNGRIGPTPIQYEVQSGAAPPPGSGILIGSGATALPAIVVSAAGAVLTVDRDLSALGVAGTTQPWQQLAAAGDLGQHAGAPEATAVLTYAPISPGVAPTSGFVWLQGAQAAVRQVTALNHDALVLSHPLPDNTPDPFDTTRWRLAAPDISGVSAGTVQTIALNAAMPAGTTALHLLPFGAATVTAGADLFDAAAVLTYADGTPPVATTPIDNGAIANPIRAGDVVVVTPATGQPVAGAIRRLRLQVTLDRNLTLSGGTVEAALIAADAPVYTAAVGSGTRELDLTMPSAGTPQAFDVNDSAQVSFVDGGAAQLRTYVISAVVDATLTYAADPANPDVPAGATDIIVQRLPLTTAIRIADLVLQLQVSVAGGQRLDMPRFVPGELVLVNFRDGTASRVRHCLVDSVAGMTLTLSDDAIIPATATEISVHRLQVQDPGNGSARWGIEGTVDTPNQITFSVWDAADGLGQPRLAIIDGGAVHAVQLVAAPQPLTIELGVAGNSAALVGTVRLARPPAAGTPTVVTDFTVDNLTLQLPLTAALIAAGGMTAIVPYTDSTRRVAGNLHAGSVRMPDDHENAGIELTRRQALEDHELMHTVQSARLGPIMLVAFPLWALELANDLTAAGGPAFSPYLAGTLNNGVLTPSNATGFEEGGKVQVAQNRRVQTVTLASAATGGGFNLSDGDRRALGTAGFGNGAVQLRRPLVSTGNDVLEWITNIGQLLTVGGLMNVLSLAGWGGLAAIIVQIVQAIRYAARSNVNVPIADDKITLTLEAGQKLEGLEAGVLVALKSGDQIFIRAVDTIVDRVVTLGAQVPLSGQVELSVYSPGASVFGLRSFYPATVADENQPARLTIAAVGNSTLSLAVHDRVEVRASAGSAHRTLVTRVDGTSVELEEAVLLRADQPNEFLIGKIAEEDPSGWLDGWLLNELHLGWMQYLHDPWGQILYRGQPAADNGAGQFFARSARYLFGTQSWMCCFLGFFWNDNAYQRANPHRSRMEQEASHRSGDTYCPLGSMHGSVAVIGDVARYWLTVSGGTRDGNGNTPTDMIAFGQQDAPTLNFVQAPTVTLPAGSSFAMPGALYAQNATGTLAGVGARGFIPTNNVLERSCGMHVAFSRPAPTGNSYRITAQGLAGLNNSLDAQSAGRATIFYDQTPRDVDVTAAGVPIAEAGATPLQVLPFQRVRFDVDPIASRVYRVTVGGEGRSFDTDELSVTARGVLGADDVEISRFHHFNGTNYDSGIGPIHLPADLHIAVRRFRMEVIDTLPLRATADHLAAAIASMQPGGDGFVLVPSPIAPFPTTVVVGGTLAVNAQLVPATATLSAQTTAFLGDGGAMQVQAPVGEPPEDTVPLTITIQVGADAASAVPVRCTFDLVPAFTLTSAGGFNVAPGTTITLTSSDGTAIQAVSPPAGLTIVATGADLAVTVDAGHAVGPVTVQAVDEGNAQRQARRVITVA